MGGLGRASSRRAEQSSRGGRRAGQTATLQQHVVSYNPPITPGTRQTRPTKKVTFPRNKAEKSPFQQHDLSILIVGPNQLKHQLSRTRKPKSRVIGHHLWVGGQSQEQRTDVLSSGVASLAPGVASLAPGVAPSAGQVAAWAPSLRRLTPQVVVQAGRPHCHLSGPAAQERVKATSKRAHAHTSLPPLRGQRAGTTGNASPHQKAKKSPFQQHDLSILIVGPNQLQYRFFRINNPKSRHKTNTFCPLTL